MLKKIISVLIVGVMTFSFIACGGNSTPKKENANSSVHKEQKEEPKKTEFAIGDAINLNGMILTVIDKQISEGGKYDKPKENKEFVIVKVKIENKSEKTIAYNPFYFKLKNSKGQITDQTFTTVNKDSALQSGDLAPGGEVEGTIAFEAPKGDTGLQLMFKDNILTKESKITINL